MNLLKFGIAGYGKMGKIREQTISDSQDASLVAIFEITEFNHPKSTSDKKKPYMQRYNNMIGSETLLASVFVLVLAIARRPPISRTQFLKTFARTVFTCFCVSFCEPMQKHRMWVEKAKIVC